MHTVSIGSVEVSRLCIGGNPFSGFSHQGEARDREMKEYFTPGRAKETLHIAEAAGVNTLFARVDKHIMGLLCDYWAEGGTIQWFAQVCADIGTGNNESESWKEWMGLAVETGAAALYIHGGLADYWYTNGKNDTFYEALELMRSHGKISGFAGHRTDVHEWVRDHLDPDFQMCSYYNPTDRSCSPHHNRTDEKWDPADRSAMLKLIQTLPCSVVHYKILGGGNCPVEEAFETMGAALRKNDVVCLGIFPKDDPQMLVKDISLFEKHTENSYNNGEEI